MLFALLLSLFLIINAEADDHGAKCPCRISVDDDVQVADCSRHQEHEPTLFSIPDCVPNSTQRLDFGFNDLRYTPGQFQRFGDLEYLDLRGNFYFAAHNDSFRSLFRLTSLDLRMTDLTFLTGEAFLDQSNLRELSFYEFSNMRWTVNQELFKHLGNLSYLALRSANQLELPNYLFIGLPNLQSLDLGYTGILTLNEYSFWGLIALKNLSLENPVETVYLPERVFKPLTSIEEISLQGLCSSLSPAFDCTTIDKQLQYLPSIKRIYIDKQLLSKLGTGFQYLTNLEELYLTDSTFRQSCEFDSVKPKLFENLQNTILSKLSLDRCFVVYVFENSFAAPKNLTTLQLTITTEVSEVILERFAVGLKHTNIQTIKLSLTGDRVYERLPAISGLRDTNLISLELTNTEYQSVGNDCIAQLPKSLMHLNLTQNCFERIEIGALKYFENLDTLDLSNQLEFQEPKSFLSATKFNSNDSFPAAVLQGLNATVEKCFGLPYKLKHLYLSNSRLLPDMIPAFCESNNSLKLLDVSHQRDTSPFESHAFWNVLKNLLQLEVLNLDRNRIDVIPRDSFTGLHKLKEISLVDNKLTALAFHVKDLVSLKTLNLSVNSIGFATDSFTSQIEEVAKKTNVILNLDKNSLLCKCRELDFVTWLHDTNVISNKGKLNCTFENGTGITLEKIARVQYLLESKCIMVEVTTGCVAMFFLLNLILALLAYIWHNKQKLRYLLLFGRRTLTPYHPIEDCEIQMEYDVYISYEGEFYINRNVTLRDFVIKKILPGLERRGVRVMIREGLVAGRNLYEEITQNVRRSKKVLVLLSRDYCQDMWNVFEFNQAVMEGIYTNRQVAIPVAFETIGREHVKEEMYAFLSMEPVHRYSPKLSD